MKKIVFPAILTTTFMMTLSSCATIFCGSQKQIILDANIPQANTVTIDGVKRADVRFPYPVKIRRGFNETVIKAEAEGYQPVMLMVNKNFNPVSIINLGFVIGWGIDAASGAMMSPEFDNYELLFESVSDK